MKRRPFFERNHDDKYGICVFYNLLPIPSKKISQQQYDFSFAIMRRGGGGSDVPVQPKMQNQLFFLC